MKASFLPAAADTVLPDITTDRVWPTDCVKLSTAMLKAPVGVVVVAETVPLLS